MLAGDPVSAICMLGRLWFSGDMSSLKKEGLVCAIVLSSEVAKAKALSLARVTKLNFTCRNIVNGASVVGIPSL